MTATQDFETILTNRVLPAEFLRVVSSSHQGEQPKVACMVSGMVAARQQDEVICPLMLRRNLIVPAHQGFTNRSAWHVA
jgi:hypothetical protein